MVGPPPVDISTTVAAHPPANAADMAHRYGQTIAWLDHTAVTCDDTREAATLIRNGSAAYEAMSHFVSQWPLAKANLIMRYVNGYQDTRKKLRGGDK
jgi:hypothetical protein